MGESAKRSRFQNDGDQDRSYKRRFNENDDKSGNEAVVYRIICPDFLMGSVIGKGGKILNSIRQDSKAKVKVVDPFPGTKNRIITIYSYVSEREGFDIDEELEGRAPLCAAQDALFRVHSAITNAALTITDSETTQRDTEECHLLVPSSQSSIIIGKSGTTIKKLRNKTNASIQVTPKNINDPAHSCAMDTDNFLLISGGPEAVTPALFAVSALMYRYRHREIISLSTIVPEEMQGIIIPSDVYPSGYVDSGSAWPVYPSSIPMIPGDGVIGCQADEFTIKILCPSNKVGRLIGKGGSTIKIMRQTSGAKIEVDDKKDNQNESLITVISTESSNDHKSAAVEAVLLLLGKIKDEDEDTVSLRLIVPSKNIGCLIGKGGSVVNEIRKKTKADVQISRPGKQKSYNTSDEVVEVGGDAIRVRDALVHIVLRLRDDALKNSDGGYNVSVGADALYPSGSRHSTVPSLLSSEPLGYDRIPESRSGLSMRSSSSLYGYDSLLTTENDYDSLAPYSSSSLFGPPPSSSLEMLIPSTAVGRVMGKGGSNIDNLRKLSGASIEISFTKSTRGDRMAHISGTPDEKATAEKMIQAFIMAP